MSTRVLTRHWAKAKPNVIQKLQSKGKEKVRLGRTQVKFSAGKRSVGIDRSKLEAAIKAANRKRLRQTDSPQE